MENAETEVLRRETAEQKRERIACEEIRARANKSIAVMEGALFQKHGRYIVLHPGLD